MLIQIFAEVLNAAGELDWNVFSELGVLGFVFILMVFKKVAPGWVLKDLERLNERLTDENDSYKSAMNDLVIPALTRATDALNALSAKEEVTNDDDSLPQDVKD